MKSLIYTTLLTFFCFYSCRTVPSYLEKDRPVWTRNNYSKPIKFKDQRLKLVSFNLELGKKTGLAISEFNSSEVIDDLDILLLQEVNENSVMEFADSLNMNYVYYPISVNLTDQSNYGNAILSHYPIKNHRKLILPHSKWTNNRKRSTTSAILQIHNKNILVYSVHTETLLMSKKKRRDQLAYIVKDIKKNEAYVDAIIVAGDFNTLLHSDIKHLKSIFQSIDMQYSSDSIGWTCRALFGILRPANDHIFSKGLTMLNSGKLSSSKSSDHIPIFVEFMLNK